MLSACWAVLRTPAVTLLRRVPGVWWVALFALLSLSAGFFGAGVAYARAGMDERFAAAERTVREQVGVAAVAKRDARAEYARAQVERQAADSARADATSARGQLAALAVRAERSRAAVDTTGLAPAVLAAIHDADVFRLAVTPTLATDSIALAKEQGVSRRLEATVHLQFRAIAADSLAIRALQDQVAMLERRHAPRCGRRCGAALGGVLVETIHQLPKILRLLLPHV